MADILSIIILILGAGGFVYWFFIGRKHEKNNSGIGSIPDTHADSQSAANDIGKNRISSLLDRAKRFISGIRSSDDSKGNPKDGSGGDSTDGNGDG